MYDYVLCAPLPVQKFLPFCYSFVIPGPYGHHSFQHAVSFRLPSRPLVPYTHHLLPSPFRELVSSSSWDRIFTEPPTTTIENGLPYPLPSSKARYLVPSVVCRRVSHFFRNFFPKETFLHVSLLLSDGGDDMCNVHWREGCRFWVHSEEHICTISYMNNWVYIFCDMDDLALSRLHSESHTEHVRIPVLSLVCISHNRYILLFLRSPRSSGSYKMVLQGSLLMSTLWTVVVDHS